MCEVLDLKKRKWVDRFEFPPNVAQSHNAMATDRERYIYAVSGQVGNNCRPATRECFAFDIARRRWTDLPLLPEARYASTMQLWNGRLHVVGGSREDRNSPSDKHWSLAVRDGVALEENWQEEVPVPTGTCHLGSALVDGALYLFGGQQGDYTAYPGDPECHCTPGFSNEVYYPHTFRLATRDGRWETLAEMPVPVSHVDFAVFTIEGFVFLCGGQIRTDSTTHQSFVTDVIQRFDVRNNCWKIVGQLPYRVKNIVVGHLNDEIFISTGSRDYGRDDPTAGPWINQTWRATLRDINLQKSSSQVKVAPP